MKTQEIKISPISFSELLAGKVADGSKWMTRRITDIGLDGNRYDVAEWVEDARFGDYVRLCVKDEDGKVVAAAPIKPKFEVGQLLYVREPWRVDISYDKPNGSAHIPDGELVYWDGNDFPFGGRKRQARFMPKRYARTFLKVTAVRCERLMEITGADAIAEGVEFDENGNFLNYEHLGTPVYPFVNDYRGARGSFLTLWNKINGANACFANPWVWVITFDRVDMPNPWNAAAQLSNSETVKP